jgi:hypothetical protein
MDLRRRDNVTGYPTPTSRASPKNPREGSLGWGSPNRSLSRCLRALPLLVRELLVEARPALAG